MADYLESGQVHIGSVLDLAGRLEPQSVQTIVTSPPYFWLIPPYCGIIRYMKKNDGRFKKGERRSPETEFKPGTHWRPPKPFREKAWLEQEYVEKQRSAREIAQEFGVTENAIYFWLDKHGIPRRTMAETRAAKHWGSKGAANPMFGKRGPAHHNWLGGITPERASCYSSIEWAEASRAVWQRDRGTCQRCGVKANDGATLHLHHIVSFAVRELRTEPSNLILLCIDCHHFVHSPANTAGEFIREA